MQHLNQLQNFLRDAVPVLTTHPDKLQIWVDDGEITFTNVDPSLTHQQSYVVNVLITEYAGSASALILPLIDYAKKNTDETNEVSIKFKVAAIDKDKSDVLFMLTFKDKVIVNDSGDGIEVEQCPVRPPWWEKEGEYTLMFDGEALATWQQ